MAGISVVIFLEKETFTIMIYPFVTSYINYYNAVYMKLPLKTVQKVPTGTKYSNPFVE